MARPQLKISVPQPCSENWGEMTPQAAGRFCASCAATVVDFSQFTDKQLVEYFTRQSGKTCGRFSATQLERAVFAETLPKQNFFPRALAAVALFLGISSHTQGQNVPDQPVPFTYIETNKNAAAEKTVAKTPEKLSGDSLVISGRVLDAEVKDGLPGVIIFFKDTKIGTSTDAFGNFNLVVPDTFHLEEILFEVRLIGYNTKLFTVLKSELPIRKDYVLELNTAVLGGSNVIIMNPRKVFFFNLWWKTKSIFRKRNYNAIEVEAE
jgi:hypothetical protein